MGPVDEMLDHLLGDIDVGDHAVTQRPDRLDVRRESSPSSAWRRGPTAFTRRTPSIVSRATTEGSLSTIALPADVDDGIHRSEIDRHVVRREDAGSAKSA